MTFQLSFGCRLRPLPAFLPLPPPGGQICALPPSGAPRCGCTAAASPASSRQQAKKASSTSSCGSAHRCQHTAASFSSPRSIARGCTFPWTWHLSATSILSPCPFLGARFRPENAYEYPYKQGVGFLSRVPVINLIWTSRALKHRYPHLCLPAVGESPIWSCVTGGPSTLSRRTTKSRRRLARWINHL
jgi:hypothetical protein